jgi:hypothetical protein
MKGTFLAPQENDRAHHLSGIPLAVDGRFVAIMVARVITTAHARWWL